MAEAEENHWWYKGLRQRVLKELGRRLPPSPVILDAGCGTGGATEALGSRFRFARIAGLDFSPLAISYARNKVDGYAVLGSVNALPFGDGEFDAAVLLDVLYHADVDDVRALQETIRVLKPGGVAVVNVPAFQWMRSQHDIVIHTARRYTTGDLRAKAIQAGFEVVDCGYRNSILFPLMVVQRLLGRMSKSRDPRSAVVSHSPPVNFLLGTVLGFENRLSGLGLRFPVGGSVFAVLARPAK